MFLYKLLICLIIFGLLIYFFLYLTRFKKLSSYNKLDILIKSLKKNQIENLIIYKNNNNNYIINKIKYLLNETNIYYYNIKNITNLKKVINIYYNINDIPLFIITSEINYELLDSIANNTIILYFGNKFDHKDGYIFLKNYNFREMLNDSMLYSKIYNKKVIVSLKFQYLFSEVEYMLYNGIIRKETKKHTLINKNSINVVIPDEYFLINDVNDFLNIKTDNDKIYIYNKSCLYNYIYKRLIYFIKNIIIFYKFNYIKLNPIVNNHIFLINLLKKKNILIYFSSNYILSPELQNAIKYIELNSNIPFIINKFNLEIDISNDFNIIYINNPDNGKIYKNKINIFNYIHPNKLIKMIFTNIIKNNIINNKKIRCTTDNNLLILNHQKWNKYHILENKYVIENIKLINTNLCYYILNIKKYIKDIFLILWDWETFKSEENSIKKIFTYNSFIGLIDISKVKKKNDININIKINVIMIESLSIRKIDKLVQDYKKNLLILFVNFL